MTNAMKIASIYVSFKGDDTPTIEEMYPYLQMANQYGSALATAAIIQDNISLSSVLFSDALTTEDKVKTVFYALFDRAPLESGLNYWVDQFENNSSYVNVTSLAEVVLKGAEANVDQTDWNYVKSYAVEFSNELESDEENSLDDKPIISEEENVGPIANAGVNQKVYEGETVTLDASDSYDTDGQIVSYSWIEDGIELSNKETFTLSDLEVGGHTISLYVTDDDGAVSRDDVYVGVVSNQEYFENNYYFYTEDTWDANLISKVYDEQDELEDLYDYLQKGEYESTSEFNARINEQGTIAIKMDLESSYNADTQTLTLYDTNLSEDSLTFDFTYFTDTSFEINNFEQFNFDYGYVYGALFENGNTIYHKMSMSSKDAQEIDNGFYLLIESNLSTDVPVTEHFWNKYTGTSNYVNVDAEKMFIINRYDNEVYESFIL